MIKIPTMFVRDETQKGHPVTNQIKPECQWVLDGEGIATRKLDGMNVKVEGGKLFKRQKPKDGDYDMASYIECDPASPSDKYLFEAFRLNLPDGIYEAIGPKIQGNPERETVHKLVRVVPTNKDLEIVVEPFNRNFDGLREILMTTDVEGIVFHHPDGRFAKIKKRDFGIKRGP